MAKQAQSKPRSVGESPVPFNEYPRPAFRRDSFFCLNGDWDFCVMKKRSCKAEGTIRVPFPPESPLSGIGHVTKKGETLMYSRTFTLPEGFQKDRVILHFGAVDQVANVLLNNRFIIKHEGGYLPFSADVTDSLCPGENTLMVLVTDPLDRNLPYGKQSRKPAGMWYTPISGIWQTVWLESVPKNPITALRIQTDLHNAHIRVLGGAEEKRLVVSGDGFAREYRFRGEQLTLNLPDGKPWTPETPHLYRITVFSGEDRVESYFALRTVTVERRGGVPLIFLNGKPYHFHGVLDQGYFPDGIFLPASSEGYRRDILQMKAHGFNMLRKHIKVEPQIFYYECDRLGMAVFQDFVNCGTYSFIRDTALPTMGIQTGIRAKRTEKMQHAFLENATGTQELLAPHPCVLLYTIFNEGWGQFSADELYERFRRQDPTRLYDSTSGWFRETKSDVDSRHVYFCEIELPEPDEKPLFLSEFGGYSFRLNDHAPSKKKAYGYRFFRDRKAWEDAVIELYEKEILPYAEKGLCATVLTQLSDVEGEVNGLLTYNRIPKGDASRFSEVAKKIRRAFENFADGLEKEETL